MSRDPMRTPEHADALPAAGTDALRADRELDSGREPSRANRAFRAGRSAAKDPPARWPEPLGADAYHGPAGEWVRLIEPETEADPAALLLQLICAFGNLIGRSAHVRVEADRHYTNLFAAVVGETAKGRKGVALNRAMERLRPSDEAWRADCVKSGLVSGEGLIWHVRDDACRGRRLLVIEQELARIVRVLGREHNTLSPVIRQAWDTGTLSTLSKKDAARATDAHISIIGHITVEELRRYLDRTEMANGFANRFLWVCARRSKLLPEGGRAERLDFSSISSDLGRAITFGYSAGELKRDEGARALWCERYPELTESLPGMLGDATSRGEAQVVRLALIYAVLDCSPEIRLPHLLAALEVWRYSVESARFVFGRSLGEPIADTIVRALRGSEGGLTREGIRALFSRHQSAPAIDRALAMLENRGLARGRREKTGGRPAERWFATPEECAESATSAESSPPARPSVECAESAESAENAATPR